MDASRRCYLGFRHFLLGLANIYSPTLSTPAQRFAILVPRDRGFCGLCRSSGFLWVSRGLAMACFVHRRILRATCFALGLCLPLGVSIVLLCLFLWLPHRLCGPPRGISGVLGHLALRGRVSVPRSSVRFLDTFFSALVVLSPPSEPFGPPF